MRSVKAEDLIDRDLKFGRLGSPDKSVASLKNSIVIDVRLGRSVNTDRSFIFDTKVTSIEFTLDSSASPARLFKELESKI